MKGGISFQILVGCKILSFIGVYFRTCSHILVSDIFASLEAFCHLWRSQSLTQLRHVFGFSEVFKYCGSSEQSLLHS